MRESIVSKGRNPASRFAAAGLLVAVLLVAQSAHAILQSADLITVGDGLITFDTDTNLEWLDVTETVGLSYNDIVLGGAGGYTALGFVFANETQVATLWANAGIVDTTGAPGTVLNRPGVDLLLGMMGCTFNCGGNQGHQAQSEFDPAQAALLNPLLQQAGGGVGIADLVSFTNNDRDFSSATLGNYLVRPVPEPTTALLMIGGLVGLVWVGRRA